jgi:hypothetical protein
MPCATTAECPTPTASTATCRVATCRVALAARGHNPRLIRHNLMLPVLADLDTQMGFEFDCRPAFMRIPGSESGIGDEKLLDFVARRPGDRDKSVGVDLTVIATMAAKYLALALAGSRARNTKPSPFAATSKAETGKHSKYDGPVASMNPPLKFVAIAFNDRL